MELYLSHTSALEWWRSAGAAARGRGSSVRDPYATEHHAASRSSAKRGGRPTPRDIDLLCALPWLSQPIHLCVCSDASRSKAPQLACHVCTSRLPPKSFVHVSANIYAASPELCLAQLAPNVAFANLIELACELCGTYRVCRPEEGGLRKAVNATTPDAVARFVADASGLRGEHLLRRAAPFVLPDSASPQETKLALLLCLPLRYGGYGLPKPQLNHRIDIDRRSAAAATRRFYRGDICWPEANLVVEYDSDAFHVGAERIAADAARRSALKHLGFDVVTITNRQMRDVAEMDRSALVISRQLGVRVRRPKTWRRAQADLRRALLGRPDCAFW